MANKIGDYIWLNAAHVPCEKARAEKLKALVRYLARRAAEEDYAAQMELSSGCRSLPKKETEP